MALGAAIQEAMETWINSPLRSAAIQMINESAEAFERLNPHAPAPDPEITAGDDREREWTRKLLAFLRKDQPHKPETERLLAAILGVEEIA